MSDSFMAAFHRLPAEDRTRICQWAVEQGIDPGNCCGFIIARDGGHTCFQFECYERDDRGRRIIRDGAAAKHTVTVLHTTRACPWPQAANVA